MNTITIAGNLGADVELKKTNTKGRSVANLSVATNRSWYERNEQGQLLVDPQTNKPILHEETQWHRVVVWGRDAENCAQYLHKGSGVVIRGRLEYRKFEGAGTYANTDQTVVDGAGNPIMLNRYTAEIVCEEIKFTDKKPQTTAYAPATGQPVAAAAAPAAGVPVPPNTVVGQPATTTAPNTQPATFVMAQSHIPAGV